MKSEQEEIMYYLDKNYDVEMWGKFAMYTKNNDKIDKWFFSSSLFCELMIEFPNFTKFATVITDWTESKFEE